MTTRKPLVLDNGLKIQELQPGDDVGAALPIPTQAGQVLYAATVTAFTVELPMVGPQGWLVSGGKMLVK